MSYVKDGILYDDAGNPIGSAPAAAPDVMTRARGALASMQTPPISAAAPADLRPPASPGMATPYGIVNPQPGRLVTEGETTSNTSSGTKFSPQHRAALEDMEVNAGIDANMRQAENTDRAQEGQLYAGAKGEHLAAADFELNALMQRQRQEAAARKAQIAHEVDALAKDKPQAYADSKSDWQKAMMVLAVGLKSLAGGLYSMRTGNAPGDNDALKMIMADRDRHDRLEKERIIGREGRIEKLRAGDQAEAIAAAKEFADYTKRQAIISTRLENILEQRLRARGVSDEELKSNEALRLERQRKEKLMNELYAEEDRKVSSTTITSKREQEATNMPGRGGAGAPHQANSDDINQVTNIGSVMKSVDQAVDAISKDPKAAEEYASVALQHRKAEAAKDTAFGRTGVAAAKVLGGLGTTPIEDMKTPGAQNIARSVQGILDTIAKSYGGVITAEDRNSAAQRVGLAAASGPAAIKEALLQIRAEFETKARNILANKRMTVTPGTFPEQGAAAAAPQRKLGSDNKWYIKGPNGWDPADAANP